MSFYIRPTQLQSTTSELFFAPFTSTDPNLANNINRVLVTYTPPISPSPAQIQLTVPETNIANNTWSPLHVYLKVGTAAAVKKTTILPNVSTTYAAAVADIPYLQYYIGTEPAVNGRV